MIFYTAMMGGGCFSVRALKNVAYWRGNAWKIGMGDGLSGRWGGGGASPFVYRKVLKIRKLRIAAWFFTRLGTGFDYVIYGFTIHGFS